jgi:type IV pilus assembly protein PilV
MSDSRGFTLIEVLLAIGLLALALLSMASMFVTGYRQTGRGAERTTAVMLASKQMEYLRNQGFASGELSAGTATSSFASPYLGYSRTTTIVDNTPIANVKQVTIQVTTPSGRVSQIVSFIGD